MYIQTHTHLYYTWSLRYSNVASAYREHMKSSEYNDHLYITNSMRHLLITNYHELIKSSKLTNSTNNLITYSTFLSLLLDHEIFFYKTPWHRQSDDSSKYHELNELQNYTNLIGHPKITNSMCHINVNVPYK